MYTGPHIIKDGLVFGYDTGYGLDNFKPTRFYKGKPAVNMLHSGDNFANWTKTANSGSNPTVTSDVAPGPFEGTLADRLSLPNDGSYPRIYQNYTPASTATHTFSVWLKAEKAEQGVFVGAFRNSPWSSPSSTNFTITDEWVNYSFAINPQDTTSMQLYIGSHNSHGGKEFLIYGAQIETGSSKSTFVNGTRSSTASLIDLKETTDIDVSNVSFDSTGQPTFDGTDDYIDLGDESIWDVGENGTFEMVVKPTNSTGNDRLWTVINNSSNLDAYLNGNSYNVYMHGGVVGTTTSLIQNQYNHLAVTYVGGTVQIYVNGSPGTMTGTTTNYNITNGGGSGNTNLYLGRFVTGTYNLYGNIGVFKVYNKGLTAAEIKQNYNAYKNRFSI